MVRFYPLADKISTEEKARFGLKSTHTEHRPQRLKAKRTGEFRCPKKGEWFLSGAIAEAYKAPNDLTQQYHIATLFKTETIEIEREVE